MADEVTRTDLPPAAETMEQRQRLEAQQLIVNRQQSTVGSEQLPDTTPPHKLGDIAEWTGKESALRLADALNKGALSRDFSDAVSLFAPHAQILDEWQGERTAYLDPTRMRQYLEMIPRTARFTPLSGVEIEEKAVVRARFRADGLEAVPIEGVWTITTDGYHRIVALRITRAITDNPDPHAIPTLPFELPDHLLKSSKASEAGLFELPE